MLSQTGRYRRKLGPSAKSSPESRLNLCMQLLLLKLLGRSSVFKSSP